MGKLAEIQKYRDAQTLKIIEGHKEIIEKTWEVLGKDVLGKEIEKAGDKENETESKFLDKLNKRRKCLSEVEVSLEKIEKLERNLSDYKAPATNATTTQEKTDNNGEKMHPSKNYARS